VTLPRGFLAQAERHAGHLREALALGPADPVDIHAVARQLEVRVVAADELIDRDRLQELERIQAFAFSASTFDINGVKVVVFNPLRSPARTQSDIAHEVSHLLLGHDLDEVRMVAGMPFRTCRPDQEEEATNLGGTLLLPRPLLLRAAREGLGVEEIAERYGVTLDMARFRFNKTGVARQTAARSRVSAAARSRGA
jgi:Zn-dependent peptidase ImmA (M78 family)